jgi:transcriptional regulator with XRE-family HTH domain
MVGQTSMGIGNALRRAREMRGVTLEEAARDSKLPVAQLLALEDEDFEPFDGEVFARAALASYARYLGLNPEKVIGAYAVHAEDPEPPTPPAKLGRVERALAASRVRDNQRFLLVAASIVVVMLIVFGLVSRERVAPEAAAIPTDAASPRPEDQTIEIVLVALRPVSVTVTIDGAPDERFEMGTGETRALTGSISVGVAVTDGSAVHVTVNGDDRGIPGDPGQPWRHLYDFEERDLTSPTG